MRVFLNVFSVMFFMFEREIFFFIWDYAMVICFVSVVIVVKVLNLVVNWYNIYVGNDREKFICWMCGKFCNNVCGIVYDMYEYGMRKDDIGDDLLN